MDEIQKLASKLRQLSKIPDQSPVSGRTQLEKLATIALIHDSMTKTSSKAKAVQKGSSGVRKLLAGAGIGLGTAGAGYAGHEKGRREGRKKGQQEMYQAALPYVRMAKRRADKATAVARYLHRKSQAAMKKEARVGKALGIAGATIGAPTAAYHYGKSKGKPKGRKRGRHEVARSAMRRVSYENARFRRALDYVMSRRKKQGGS